MSRADPRTDPSILLVIAAGGALGTLARYGVARLVTVAPDAFPWATFWTNVSGSLVLGAVLTVLIRRHPTATHVRAFVATGFLGAYTTYSTFAVETVLLSKDGNVPLACIYAAASLVAGFGAVVAGIAIGRRAAAP
ncbi:MAG: fluoride exporter [Actinomycetota bacterium]|nr:fluoride exporter [Actinomycetota bacterium]